MTTIYSFLLLAIAAIVICSPQGRAATVGRVRSVRAVRTAPTSSTSIRAACIGATAAATMGNPCVACALKNLTLVPLTGRENVRGGSRASADAHQGAT